MRKLGLPQKTWEWHELMAQSFSLSPTKSKSSFQSFTSTQVVTASLALGWLKDPPNSWSHSLPAKGKERLGQNTGAHTGSQTHFISAPHASGWLLSLAPSLVTPLHTPPCLSVFSSTHYLHLRFDFRTPPTRFFSPQSDSNSWCIYLRWCGCCKMKYLQQPVCGWFERRRVSTMSFKEGVRYKSCLQTARLHSRLQRHLFVWKVGWVFLPPFSFSWTWKRMKVAGCVHSFRLIMRVGLTGMVIWQPLHFL